MIKHVIKLFCFLCSFGAFVYGFSSTAAALSCVEFTIEKKLSMMPFDEDAENIVILGDLAIDGELGYIRGNEYSENYDSLYQRTSGHIKGTNIKTGEPFDHDIVLEQHCVSVWCGRAESTTDGVFFITHEKESGKYVLPLMPCGGNIFANLTQEQKDKVQMCLQKQVCTEKEG
ncbi:MAG: hypothetical protein ACLFR0_00530 [Alphaproteobacteria bacterium]